MSMKRHAIFAVFALLAVASTAAPAARGRDGAVIRNTGSTNAPAFSIKLRSDGSASVRTQSKPGARHAVPAHAAEIPLSLAARFFAAAAASRREAASTAGGCVKSASFGSSTTVLWHGWTSGDLSCPQTGAHARALAAVVAQIVGLATSEQPSGHSVHLPINEPRRAPVEGTPPPRATPPAR